MEELFDRLDKVRQELINDWDHLDNDERDFLIQRAIHIMGELKDKYKILTSI